MSKSLALVGLRVLDDARFAREVTHRGSCAIGVVVADLFAWTLVVQVKDAFEKDRKERGVDSIQWR